MCTPQRVSTCNETYNATKLSEELKNISHKLKIFNTNIYSASMTFLASDFLVPKFNFLQPHLLDASPTRQSWRSMMAVALTAEVGWIYRLSWHAWLRHMSGKSTVWWWDLAKLYRSIGVLLLNIYTVPSWKQTRCEFLLCKRIEIVYFFLAF